MEEHVMAREYNPPTKPVEMRVYVDNHNIAGNKVEIWYAQCDQHRKPVSGASEAEAVRNFQSHLSRHHNGQVVRKVS
jgi:hypothetical protein